MDYKTILLEKRENVAIITLNRPERLNALGDGMIPELLLAFEEVDNDDDIRVVVLTGAGRGFCSGADIGRRSEGGKERAVRGADDTRRGLTRGATPLISGLQKLEKPTIAMVNGVATGAGFDLALACDLRVGSENARFMNAFVRIGLVPGFGGTWLYPRVMGLGKALEYLFTGDFIDAKEAEKIGILNYMVPADDLESKTMALAGKIAKGPPIAIRLMKLQVYKGLNMDLETALRFAAITESITSGSEDNKEGVRAFVEKREAKFEGK